MLHCVVKSPLLSDMYAKQCRKTLASKQISKHNNDALKQLIINQFEEKNAETFINELSESVRMSLLTKSDEKDRVPAKIVQVRPKTAIAQRRGRKDVNITQVRPVTSLNAN